MGKACYFKASPGRKYLQTKQFTEKFEEIGKTRRTYEVVKKHIKSYKGLTGANKNIQNEGNIWVREFMNDGPKV